MAYCGHILVIEDDAALGDFIIEALTDEGYPVRVVPDAASIGAALGACMPDLVLCDLRVPGVLGRSLLAHVQQTIPTDVPIVVMTADVHAARYLDGLNVAFCLFKPFELDALLAGVTASMRVPNARP